MSTADIALAAIAGAGGVLAFGRLRPAQLPGAKAGTPPVPQEDAPSDPNAAYVSGIFKEWGSLISTAGTFAGALGAYQLTKEIGKGQATMTDHWRIIGAIAVFALGLTLLIVVPVALRTRTMASLADAVKAQPRG
ncbi:MAG: hypothetical protein R2706_19615 [Acidimicrobiales bacterium]